MNFWKMQGCGNDFILIDGRFDGRNNESYSLDAKKYCSRKFSIGADGLIIVKESDIADVTMVYYNADGSRAAMCGNGIRCFSKYILENNIVDKNKFTVETLNGIKEINIDVINHKVDSVSVYMGEGQYEPKLIPMVDKYHSKESIINEKINIIDTEFEISAVLMGVPHAVIFINDEMSIEDVEKYGKAIENNAIFPKKINVNFVKVMDRNNIFVQTWERGCGYTFGCGTGMTATAMISHLLNKTNNKVNVSCAGGSVEITLTDIGAYMKGSAEKVYEGIIK